MRTGRLAILILLTGRVVMADAASDLAKIEQSHLKQARPLALETALVVEGRPVGAIVPADGAPWSGAAVALQEAIQQVTGVTLPLLPASEVTADDWANRSLVVLGNLVASPVYARLYHNFFVCADQAYTGDAGYELRTVCDPWGSGHNAIALGAQAAAGLEAGVAKLSELIAKTGKQGELELPQLMDLHLVRQGRREPVEQRLSEADIQAAKAALEAIYARPGTERAAAHRTVRDGMSYHRTGDPGWLEAYRYAIRRQMQYYATNEYIVNAGPRRYDRDFRDSWAWGLVVSWDLVEEAPGWTDAERLAITNHVLRVVYEATMYQGWDNPERVAQWQSFRSITHNHHTWPGLAVLFGGWYFQRHYHLPVAEDWLKIGYGMFESCKHSSKPWEDSAGYQYIPMRHVLTYELATGDDTYVDQGHAAETGKVALMCIDSLGHQPAFGDHSGLTGTAGLPPMLSGLLYATRDGRYRWALNRLASEGPGELEEPRWVDVDPVRPDDLTGVAVSYLPQMHYDLLGRNDQFFPTPNLPYPETFDKLTLRAGWNETDDYLFLDGYAGGSHGHLDANAIISYVAAGAHWLVDGEYIRLAPKYHCTVTVTKDGQGVQIPPCVKLNRAAWLGDGGLVQTEIPAWNGIRWVRSIVWQPNGATAVIDELTALEPGTYGLRACWRVLGETSLDGDTLAVRQREKGFALKCLSGQTQSLTYLKDAAGWPVHHLYQRQSAKLAKGETVRFLNVFQASADGVPTIDAQRCGDAALALTSDGRTEVFGVGGLRQTGLETDAVVYRLSPETAWLAGATRYEGGGQQWQGEPSDLRVAGGGVVVAEPESTPHAGQQPATRLTGQLDATPLALGAAVATLATPLGAAGQGPQSVLGDVARAQPLWRVTDLRAAQKPLVVETISSEPAPLEKYSPSERLIDGRYSSSVNSCMFPAGQRATITLDLGATLDLREVRLRAWEMNDTWLTKDRRLRLSNDDFAQDDRPVDREFGVVGTERWGNNVNTIYGLSVTGRARYVRVELAPQAEEASVYLAEIEVYGLGGEGHAEITATASGDLDADGKPELLVGTAAGELAAVNAQGMRLWSADLGLPVTALAAADLDGDGKAEVVYGVEPDLLGVLNPDGSKRGEAKLPQYRGIASRIENLSVADLQGDGQEAIVCGALSWQYLAYSADLKLLWKTVIYAHGATVGLVTDLDGDGQQETIAGNAYYRLNIIGADGKMLRQAGRFGPEQSAVAAGDLNGDGVKEVVVGTDVGTLLAFTLAGEQLWELNLGDRVTGIVVLDGEVVAASETGYLWRLGGDGVERWRRSVGATIDDLAERDGSFLAATDEGVVDLTPEGQPRRLFAMPAAAQRVVVLDDLTAAALADGSVVAGR